VSSLCDQPLAVLAHLLSTQNVDLAMWHLSKFSPLTLLARCMEGIQLSPQISLKTCRQPLISYVDLEL